MTEPAPDAAEARLRAVAWAGLAGLGPALDAPLAAVLGGEAAQDVLDRFLRAHRLPAAARAAAAEAVFGVGLWRRRLRWHAGAEAPVRALLAALLRDLGAVPEGEVERLLELPSGGLTPARPPPSDLADRYSLPGWLAEVLAAEAGPEAPALADALDRPGPVCLRPNLLATTPSALARELAADGIATRPGLLLPTALVVTTPRPNVYGLRAHREGLFEVQDEGSQLLGALVDARPGEAVLDVCAGAGGKALQLAAAVGPGGAVHATDIDAERLARMAPRAARAGAAAILRVHGPAAPDDLVVDRALVDAPCSSLGALRRGPDQRWRLDPADFAPLPALQASLLAGAARHVRPGGRLVYATCTFRRAENEEVALAFEREHPAFAREPPPPGAPATAAGHVRTWPHRQGCDGFFAALWTRRSW